MQKFCPRPFRFERRLLRGEIKTLGCESAHENNFHRRKLQRFQELANNFHGFFSPS